MTSAEKKERKKTALFNHFAANLSLFYPQYSNVFACPLCREFFADTSELDLAHIWPKKLGGHLVTLTCRECNNTVGSTIESYEARRAEYNLAEKLRARMKVEGVEGNIGIDFYPNANDDTGANDEGTWVRKLLSSTLNPADTFKSSGPIAIFKVLGSESNPKVVEAIFQRVKIGSAKIKVNYSGPHGWSRARFTYLHFSFLYMFHNFGYEWVVTEHAEQIREQLKNPDSSIYEPVMLELPDFLAEGKEGKDVFSFVVYEPQERVGFLVATPTLSHEGNRRWAIYFPATASGLDLPLKKDELEGVDLSVHRLEETHPYLSKTGAERIINDVLYYVSKEKGKV